MTNSGDAPIGRHTVLAGRRNTGCRVLGVGPAARRGAGPLFAVPPWLGEGVNFSRRGVIFTWEGEGSSTAPPRPLGVGCGVPSSCVDGGGAGRLAGRTLKQRLLLPPRVTRLHAD